MHSIRATPCHPPCQQHSRRKFTTQHSIRRTTRLGAQPALLEVENLHAEVADTGKKILNGVSLVINAGEVHAVFGRNGSGKSTLSKVVVGSPDYVITSGDVKFKGKSIQSLDPEERAQLGLFLSFQSPIEIPGVSNSDFLRVSTNAVRKAKGLNELDPLEFFAFVSEKLQALSMDPVFLNRNVNEGFSGGERKRNEILQLACLEAQMAILDEIDSGLDIDALADIGKAVMGLKKDHPEMSVLMVTHYKRLLDHIKPDHIHVMQKGEIVMSGGLEIVDTLESGGYAALSSQG